MAWMWDGNISKLPWNTNEKHNISISSFDRIWKNRLEEWDPDDISEIDTRNHTIDIGPVIREEIIMACHNDF